MVVPEDFEADAVNISRIAEGKYLTFQIVHTAEAVSNFYASLFNVLSKENYMFDTDSLLLERYNITLVNEGFCEFCAPIL